MTYEDCEGCTCWNSGMDMICVPHYKELDCPCINCLIKMMCGDGCEEHETYVAIIEHDAKRRGGRYESV